MAENQDQNAVGDALLAAAPNAPAPDAAASEDQAPAPQVLSTGAVFAVRKPKGRDLERGAAAARDASNPMSLFMGVIAQVVTIEGRRITYEDVLEMEMEDVMLLIGELGGKAVRVPSLPSGINS